MGYRYLHCSMYGSYLIDCKIIRKEVFDVKKHGDFIQMLFAYPTEAQTKATGIEGGMMPKEQGKPGYIIKYTDPFTNEKERKWVGEEYIKYE